MTADAADAADVSDAAAMRNGAAVGPDGSDAACASGAADANACNPEPGICGDLPCAPLMPDAVRQPRAWNPMAKASITYAHFVAQVPINCQREIKTGPTTSTRYCAVLISIKG